MHRTLKTAANRDRNIPSFIDLVIEVGAHNSILTRAALDRDPPVEHEMSARSAHSCDIVYRRCCTGLKTDKFTPTVGIEVLLLGAGAIGLILAQLLKLNGVYENAALVH
ncbi:hypothetical protein B0H15DRAFT_971620 [Mycena belliarum]|uniref:Uncharacterized protein n=1 Tax=Mycena belliarum TaxID=1033014 RepID=A0AAD6TN96_9AGAR|nr:hypothetical protein B0H15DRAFT_971620 [Mycena belliae]